LWGDEDPDRSDGARQHDPGAATVLTGLATGNPLSSLEPEGGNMSTPERQQDPGEHGYGGTQQEKNDDDQHEHPLEDPEADPRHDQEDPDDESGE
jgi:hypothetical protein